LIIKNTEDVLKEYVDWEGQGFRHFMEFLGIYEVGNSRSKRKLNGNDSSEEVN